MTNQEMANYLYSEFQRLGLYGPWWKRLLVVARGFLQHRKHLVKIFFYSNLSRAIKFYLAKRRHDHI